MQEKIRKPIIQVMKMCGFFAPGYLLFIVIWFVTCFADILQSVTIGVSIDYRTAEWKSFLGMIVVCIICVLYSYSFSVLHPFFMNKYLEKRMQRIRVIAGQKLLYVPYIEIENMQRGEMISRTMGDLEVIQKFFEYHLGSSMITVIEAIAGLIISFIISWELTIVIFISLLIVIILNVISTKSLGKVILEQKEQTGFSNGIAMNVLQQISSVKAFNLETVLSNKFFGQLRKAQNSEEKIVRMKAKLTLVQSISNVLIYFSMMIAGGYLVINHQLTVGKFTIILCLLNATAQLAGGFQELVYSYKECKAGAIRLLGILNLTEEKENEVPFISDAKENNKDTIIEIKEVFFHYQSKKESPFVLKDVNLTVKRGQKIAIVGASGCGKSTLIKLISGLYLPSLGSITVDGLPLISGNQGTIRRKMAVVIQENYLFPISIADNIRCGKPLATMSEIIEAAKQAGIHEFISALPDGYDTVIDENGANISGGQKQRVCIARAYIRKPEILILDEPTASLDTETERKVQESMAKLMKGKTTITIAHRLSTIKDVDLIYCMKDGCIQEYGTHHSLYHKKGLYYQLYQMQETAIQKA